VTNSSDDLQLDLDAAVFIVSENGRRVMKFNGGDADVEESDSYYSASAANSD